MKRWILIGCCVLLVSCTNIYNDQLSLYNQYVDEITSYNEMNTDTNLPFDIKVYFEKVIDDEITYRIIVDNPKEEMKNIKAIAIHDYPTTDVFPTSGVFEKPLHMSPDIVNMNDNYVKGFILIGYIDFNNELEGFDGTVKVLIQYDDVDGNLKKVYYQYHK